MEVKNFSRAIKIRIALRFLTTFSNTTVMPFVVLFFVNQIGAVKTTMLIVIIGVMGVAGGLLGGKLADSYGRKKFILIGEILTAIGFFIIAISNITEDFLIIGSMIGFLLIYFFSSLAQPAYGAFILDETNEQNRKSVYSYMMWSAYLAIALGSTVGGLLFATYKIELFILVGICSLISFSCVAIWIPESASTKVNNSKQLETTPLENVYKSMLKNPVFLILAYMSFIFALMDSQLAYYLSIRYFELFHDKGYEVLGFLHAENTIISVIFLLWLTHKLKKYREINVAINGAILFFIGYIFLSLAQQPLFLFIAMAIATIGEIVLFPSLQTITANIIPNSQRARYLSVFSVFSNIGGLFASFFMLLLHVLSSAGFTVLYGVIGLMSIVVLYRLKVIQGYVRSSD